MPNQVTRWIFLLTLCLVLAGCGGEEQDTNVDRAKNEPAGPPVRTEVIVEPSDKTVFIDGEARPSVELVRALLVDPSLDYPVMAVINTDDAFESPTQVKFSVEIGEVAGRIGEGTVKVLADQTTQTLKAAFEARTKQALKDELAFSQSITESAAEEVKAAQKALQVFQESRRSLPQTSDSRLERRTIDRQYELALQTQIETSKRIEALQKRIDRERYVTLLRVK